jgi:hypothetical protein
MYQFSETIFPTLSTKCFEAGTVSAAEIRKQQFFTSNVKYEVGIEFALMTAQPELIQFVQLKISNLIEL